MDPLTARLVVAFVVGGGTVALFTLAAERLGSRVGGLLLSFPVKVAITLVLVALNEGATVAAEAAAVAPGGLAANVAFLAVAVLALRKELSLAAALAGGLTAWLVVAALVVAGLPRGLLWSVAAFAVAAAATFAFLSRGRVGAVARAAKPRPGALGVLGRALFAGLVVSLAVLTARVAGPTVGGVMAVFPSGFLTSVAILHRAQGSAFTAETARTMVVGLAAPTLYLVVVALLYATLHVAVAPAGAGAAAVATSVAVGHALSWGDARAAVRVRAREPPRDPAE